MDPTQWDVNVFYTWARNDRPNFVNDNNVQFDPLVEEWKEVYFDPIAKIWVVEDDTTTKLEIKSNWKEEQ